MKKYNINIITVITFCILVFGFTFLNIITKDKNFSESENRYLKQRPSFSFEKLVNGQYTKDYEEYITDQFVFRDGFVGIKTQSEYLLGKRDTNGVYFGNDGYLIQKHSKEDVDILQSEKNVENLKKLIKKYKTILGEDRAYAMIIPTSSEILTNKIPRYASGFNQTEYINKIDKLLGDNFINTIKPLSEHKDEYIYYKTDHHWTSLGAFYGYNEYAKKTGNTKKSKTDFCISKLTDEFYGTTYSKARLFWSTSDHIEKWENNKYKNYSLDINMGKSKMSSLYDMEKLKKRDKYSVFLGGNNPVLKITSENKNGKHLLIIKDSYAHTFAQFIAGEYETVHMIDLRYFGKSLEQYTKDNNITDMLVLYNAFGFANDINTSKFLS